jgi:hypothetical protein
MGSTLAIVIAIAAVVVGFLILKNIRDDDGDSSSNTTVPTATTVDANSTTTVATLPAESTTTIFTPTTDGALVIVANSSHQNGVAGQLSTALQGQNYTMGTPTNGSGKEELTRIQYKDGDAQAQAVAQSLAVLMAVTVPIEVMPVPPQLSDPNTLGDATVLVLLGDDKAGKTLEQMANPSTDTTSPGASSSSAAP